MKNIIYNNKKKKETKFIKFTLSKLGKKKVIRLNILCIHGFQSTSGQCEYSLKERSRSTVKLFRTFLSESHRTTSYRGT